MPRWEHCKLEDFYAMLIGQPNPAHTVTITMYKANGEVQISDKEVPDDEVKEYWNSTIAQLGARGWELLNVRVDEKDDEAIGGYAILVEYIFKRPVPSPSPKKR